jgi:poly-gamma-glutamate capsule biosynthesis protein CapA/YwtB (metallophosphatase superfamily)
MPRSPPPRHATRWCPAREPSWPSPRDPHLGGRQVARRVHARPARAAPRADIVVASHHWGLFEEVLDYQVEIAHGAIDAGADVVMGHGPHYACAVEMYRGKPIFSGLGSFSFHTGHEGRAHGDWVGMLARLTFDDSALVEVAFSMVRHNERNETYVCDPRQDTEAVEQIMRRCDKLGTTLTVSGSEMIVWKKP